jgi:4-aminobutyrate aminotransferase
MIARAEISTWGRSAHGSTFGGNPVACAAAAATIQIIEDGLVDNAAAVGSYLKEKLTALKSTHAAINDVRGLGLMVGVEFAQTDASRRPDADLRNHVMQKCFERGLLVLNCGESTLRFCPPLIVSRAEVNTAVEIFDAALRELRA